MHGWGLFWVGLLTMAFSAWYARPRPPLEQGAFWWLRSARSYAEWKGRWAPVTVVIGAVMTVLGLIAGLSGS